MAMGISKVDLISYMSRWHRFAAIRHRDAALKFEAAWRPERGSDGTINPPGPSLNIHRAEVVGAVIFSVCWMEAVAHELVYIAGRPGNPYGRNMLHPLRKHLKEPRKETKGSTLPLLKEALKAAGMGVGRSYGDATTLEKVRHTLVHGKPTETGSCPDEHPDFRPDEHPDGHPPLSDSELSGSDQAEKPTTAWIEVETKRQKWKQERRASNARLSRVSAAVQRIP